MKRLLTTSIAFLVILAATVSGTAVAYFSTSGTGSAAAGVSKLSTPLITAATPAAGGTVALSWSAVSAPDSGTVTYSVSRNGGSPAGTCPSSASPAAVTSCTDSGLEPGTYSYVVTATWRSWTSASAVSQAKITVGPAHHFVLTAASSTAAAGVADNLTITAKDASGSIVTTYAGSHNLTFAGAATSPAGTKPTVANSSGTAVAFGTATAITFTSGVASVSSTKNGVMKLYASGEADIDVSDGSISTEVLLEVTVTPATASKLALAAVTTTPTAASADNLTTTAQDTYGNTATSYVGAHSLTFTGASASPNGTLPTVADSAGAEIAFGAATSINFSAGVAGVSAAKNGVMKLYKSGAATIKVSDGTLSATLATTAVASTAATLLLAAASTVPVAGATDNLTTTAQDAYGNTATTYTGAHNLTFSGSSASPNGTLPTVVNSAGTAIAFGSVTALSFTAGIASVASSKNGVMKLNRAGPASISASDGSIASTAVAVTVSAGTASKLALTNVVASAGTLAPTCLFTCTLTGLGSSGTVSAKVAVADSLGNTVSALGTGHAVKVTTNGTGTIAGTPLAIPSTGAAETATTFTYTSKSSTTEVLTAAVSEGTAYTSATLTASK